MKNSKVTSTITILWPWLWPSDPSFLSTLWMFHSISNTRLLWNIFCFIFYCVFFLSFFYSAKIVDMLSLYQRIPNNYLKSMPQKVIGNVTVYDCARFCAMEVEFECKSFDIDNQNIECHLHNHTHRDPLIGLQYSLGFDHYRSKWCRFRVSVLTFKFLHTCIRKERNKT